MSFDFNLLEREEIFKTCDLVILPKIDSSDYELLKDNQILWGWTHTVQGFEIAQLAIDKKLTLIAWENMYVWKNEDRREHIFLRNNEIAGYAAVNHFLSLIGTTPGLYGEGLRVAVLGYGSSAKGSVHANIGLGCTDVTVFSKRNKFQISDAIKNVSYKTYDFKDGEVTISGKPAYDTLKNYDLIINCVLQDPLNPMIFIKEEQIISNGKQLYIIDVSCDLGMGFDFAKPSTFDEPLIITDKYIYYSVDHTPSYFWEAASYEISGALFPYLKHILNNDKYNNIVLSRAVDIENGIIKNSAIIEFQNRDNIYPHSLKNI